MSIGGVDARSSRAFSLRSRFYPLSSILYPRLSTLPPRRHAGADTPGSPRLARRGAFTLMELLVVITIIGVLMTLVIQVVGAFITQARDSATKATVGKLQGLSNSRAQALNRLTMRTGFVNGSAEMGYVKYNPVFQNVSPQAQPILATKYLEMKFFPQSIQDITQTLFVSSTTNGGETNGTYPALFNSYKTFFSNPQPPGQNLSKLQDYDPTLDANHTLRSSEILYHSMTQSNVVGGSPVGSDAFSAAEVKDTDGNGLPEFIDAWGNPLRFYRWPTRLFRSGGAIATAPYVANFTIGDLGNARMLFSTLPVFSGNLAIVGTPNGDLARDPDDPLQIFVNNPIVSSVQFEQNFHTPATYHVLLIMSAGPDGKLGLCEPDSIDPYTGKIVPFGNLALPSSDPNFQDQLTDNIMYLNVRAGGK